MELEILAPAGGPESLKAAVLSGADAVYLGAAGELNARRGAIGFSAEQLVEAVAFCHARGVKVYQTINTLIRESEKDLLIKAARHACEIGVDAVLVQDMSVAGIFKAACPEMPLHASTQTGVTGVDGVLELERLGFSRVVLGRELSLEEIREIRARTKMELEIFVHGALCMSVSGQCYLSSLIGARSGNRGLCAQPCRLPVSHGKCEHALSLKDLSLLDRLAEISEAGICSVKIEGRMKRPEYVAAAVSACKAARDGGSYDAKELAALFSRGGFTQGFLSGRRDASMFGVRDKEDVTAATESLLKRYRNLFQKEAPRVPVKFQLYMEKGLPPRLKVEDSDGFSAEVFGASIAEQAINAPTTFEKAQAALSKTGGTPFYSEDIKFDTDNISTVPMSALNDLRRRALESLLELRMAPGGKTFDTALAKKYWDIPRRDRLPDKPAMKIRLGRADQFPVALESGCASIILPLHLYDDVPPELIKKALDRLSIELPKTVFGYDGALVKKLADIKASGVTSAVAGSLGAINLALSTGFTIHGDASLNIFNTPALGEYEDMGLDSATLSYELNLREAVSIGGTTPRGIVAYGYLPLMALRNCPAKAHGGKCKGIGCGYPVLKDRMNKTFFVDCDGRISTMYNSLPLWMGDRLSELRGLDFYTLYLTRETPEEARDVIKLFSSGEKPDYEYTRGLYYRSENADAKVKKAPPDAAGRSLKQ